ncbi:MAG: ribonuclease P protein component [Elusimicrobia bacterium]|nr:ribonuclease P protein component [Elusimicrobiota bacterium]
MKLSTKRKIQILLDKGTRWGHGPFVFFALPAANSKTTMGTLIGRQAYRRSVDRNRLKRLVRVAWQNISPRPNQEILVIIKRGLEIKNVGQAQINTWLSQGLQKQRLPARCA